VRRRTRRAQVDADAHALVSAPGDAREHRAASHLAVGGA